jgi:hypothetical protein
MKNMEEEEILGTVEGCLVFVYKYLNELSTASVKRVEKNYVY